jgi:hypothetical protein
LGQLQKADPLLKHLMFEIFGLALNKQQLTTTRTTLTGWRKDPASFFCEKMLSWTAGALTCVLLTPIPVLTIRAAGKPVGLLGEISGDHGDSQPLPKL